MRQGKGHNSVVPPSGGWTEQRVARELEAWFERRAFERWPSYRTFVEDGCRGLYDAARRTGGAERWAPELGVAPPDGRPGTRLADADVRDVLLALLREHRPDRFPSDAWLAKHGPRGLVAAAERTGGGAGWARRFGIRGPQPARWTDELIEIELRRVCAGALRWPTKDEFRRAGATGVLQAVYAGHGSRSWARHLGLPPDGLRERRHADESPLS